MPLEVDGTAILTAIARSPADFGLNASQLNALAIATLLARFKDKVVDLERLRRIAGTLTEADFGLALDHMATKDIAALIKRLDAKNPELRGSDETWQRDRIKALVQEGVEPAVVAKPVRPARVVTPRAKTPKTGEVMKSKALKVRSKASSSSAG